MGHKLSLGVSSVNTLTQNDWLQLAFAYLV